MKNRRKMMLSFGAAFIAAAVAGCGIQQEKPHIPAAHIQSDDVENTQQEKPHIPVSDTQSDDVENTQQEKPHIPVSDTQSDDVGDIQQKSKDIMDEEGEKEQPTETDRESELLIGNVNSVGENSLIVSKAFQEGGDVLVHPVDGNQDQVLVTVILSETTQYEIKIVKNGGVNGDADVEKQSGAFSNLENEMTIDVLGYYEGDAFVAEKICMYKFV